VRPELRGHGRRGAAEGRFGPILRGIGARRRAVSSLVLRESSPGWRGFAPFGRAPESTDEGGVLVLARAGRGPQAWSEKTLERRKPRRATADRPGETRTDRERIHEGTKASKQMKLAT
jgi:hypothetical protein